jgi:putative nucleotidyltransferase with HDIG domain
VALESLWLNDEILPASAGEPPVRALLLMIAAKHRPTYVHLCQVASYTELLARELQLSRKESVLAVRAALLHDVGKIAVADEILTKPGPLTDAEMAVMVHHAEWGNDILARTGGFEPILDAVRSHHEWFDGRGYPAGLRGSEIPHMARMIAVTDAFDTMTSPRPYRRSCSVDSALEELAAYSGTQFDPEISGAFASALTASVTHGVTRAQHSPLRFGQKLSQAEPLALRLIR